MSGPGAGCDERECAHEKVELLLRFLQLYEMLSELVDLCIQQCACGDRVSGWIKFRFHLRKVSRDVLSVYVHESTSERLQWLAMRTRWGW